MRTHSTTQPQRMTRLTRVERAQRLVAFGHVHPDPAGRGHRYWVDSDRGDTRYRVEISKTAITCTCVDWQRHYEVNKRLDAYCKHAIATVLYRRAIADAFRPHQEAA